jgi:3-dehydroquinate synthase
MDKVIVGLKERSYDIIIGNKILKELHKFLANLNLGKKILIISNPTVFELYGQAVIEGLGEQYEIAFYLVEDSENAKSIHWVNKIYDFMIDYKMDRQATIVALGGGVVGDLAGFVAATYMRGIHFIQIPTTVLAQVDSSVGGKVGINHEKGKNLIGAFYQPKLVVCDVDTLNTLPMREIYAGLAEVIKYGIIYDRTLFNILIEKHKEILALNTEQLEKIIKRSCEIKARIVEEDEKELGIRANLNFGHTFGHALENISTYGKYRHGEAVGIGMAVAGKIALSLDHITIEDYEAILKSITLYHLATEIPEDYTISNLIKIMELDKKNKDNQIRMILPTKIGQVISQGFSSNELLELLSR